MSGQISWKGTHVWRDVKELCQIFVLGEEEAGSVLWHIFLPLCPSGYYLAPIFPHLLDSQEYGQVRVSLQPPYCLYNLHGVGVEVCIVNLVHFRNFLRLGSCLLTES